MLQNKKDPGEVPTQLFSTFFENFFSGPQPINSNWNVVDGIIDTDLLIIIDLSQVKIFEENVLNNWACTSPGYLFFL